MAAAIATTATQARSVHPQTSAIVTVSAAHAMPSVQLVMGLIEAPAQAVTQAGGCTMVSLAPSARTATPMQTALRQTHIAACRTTCATFATPLVPHAVGLGQAAA